MKFETLGRVYNWTVLRTTTSVTRKAHEQMESLDKILFLILGWLFGLLSPAIVDSIRKRREAKEVKVAILPELHGLQYRLAMTVYLIENRYGQITREFIEWLYPILKGYHGVDSSIDYAQSIKFYLSLTDEQLVESTQIAQSTTGRGLALKKHSLPLLESKMASLVWFDETLRAQLLEIKTRIGLLNEGVDENHYFFNLTFQNSINPENYRAAEENIIKTCRAYVEQARIVVDLIGKMK